MNMIRLNEEEELLGGDIHYFAPIQLKGSISQYAKGLQLTRLNSEMIAVKSQKSDIEMQEKLGGGGSTVKVAPDQDDILGSAVN